MYFPPWKFLIKNHKSNFVLSVQDASKAKDARLVQWFQKLPKDGLDQLWMFKQAERGVLLVNVNSGLCATAPSKYKGVPLVQCPEDHNSAQLWQSIDLGGGLCRLENYYNQFAMAIQDGSNEPGRLVVQWPYEGASDQQWSMILTPSE
jgi:alpha-galactosidase